MVVLIGQKCPYGIRIRDQYRQPRCPQSGRRSEAEKDIYRYVKRFTEIPGLKDVEKSCLSENFLC